MAEHKLNNRDIIVISLDELDELKALYELEQDQKAQNELETQFYTLIQEIRELNTDNQFHTILDNYEREFFSLQNTNHGDKK